MSRRIDIHVRLDAATFRRYCAFDNFRRQRRWFAPTMIGMVLITVALAGLLNLIPLGDSASGILMGLGFAVPMVVFGLYIVQIEAQIAARGLKSAPSVYSLALEASGVTVTNDQKQEPPVALSWDQFWAAFRRRDCVYLYISPDRALILPDGQASAPGDEVWRFLCKYMEKGRCVG